MQSKENGIDHEKAEHDYKNHIIPNNLEFQNKPLTSQPSSCRRTANHTGWHECLSFYTFQPGDHIIGQEAELQKTKKHYECVQYSPFRDARTHILISEVYKFWGVFKTSKMDRN